MKKTNILALSWRDIKAPKMGGAEVLSHGIIKRLDPEKYAVVHISPMFPGAEKREMIDGILYIRKGNVLTVIIYAFIYYIRHRNKIDYVMDECNTHRFFTPFYVPREKRVLLIHQLTREIWFINSKFPLSIIGYLVETPMLRIYRKNKTITVSDSTKEDLVAIGFDPEQTYIMPNGIDPQIQKYAYQDIPKDENTTFIYVGRYAAY